MTHETPVTERKSGRTEKLPPRLRVEVADGRGEAPTRFSRETSCRSDPAVRLSPFRPPKGRVGRNIVLFQKQTGRFLERNVTVCDSRFLTHCLHFPQTPPLSAGPFRLVPGCGQAVPEKGAKGVTDEKARRVWVWNK